MVWNGTDAAVGHVHQQDSSTVDIFLGVTLHHAAPNPTPGNFDGMTGAVRWLRWDGTMSTVAFVSLDPGSDRGAFGVAGLAVADLLEGSSFPGDELVVTSLAGDLYVFSLHNDQIGAPLIRTWVGGSLGVCNGIVIDDLDLDGKVELYLGGSLGIRKFKQISL